MRSAVIGAGFGGLAAALRLRARGHEVTVYDRLDCAGGRGRVFKKDGFVFDAGPTVITAPFLLEELFNLHGRQMADYVELRPVYPWYRIRFDDGTLFNYGGSIEQTLAEIARFSPEDVDGYKRFLQKSREIFDVGFTKLGAVSFESPLTMLKAMPDMIKLQSYLTVYRLASKYIKNEKLRRVFSFQPLLVGGNPFTTTSIYSLIHHVEREWGVHFAMGGTGALVAALVRLAEEVGIDFKLNCQINQIQATDGTVTQITTQNGETIDHDLIVVNGDAANTYKNLIDGKLRRKWTDKRIENLNYSMGLFVLYFGTRKKYPQAAHHTILLGKRYKELLADIFDRKVLTEDVSLYLHVPTVTDTSLAPDGCESMYVLCPVPNLQGQIDWSKSGPWLKDRIVEYLSETELPGLKENICSEFYVTPEYFRDSLLSLNGSAFSIQPVLTQSAYFRFHNRSEELKNLFFVGAGTHPGAGLPGVLLSAKVLEEIFDRDQLTAGVLANG